MEGGGNCGGCGFDGDVGEVAAQGIALLLRRPDGLGGGGEEGEHLVVALFGCPEQFDRLPDRGRLGGEVHRGHQGAPTIRFVLAEGGVELAGRVPEVVFCCPEGWAVCELESVEARVSFAVG